MNQKLIELYNMKKILFILSLITLMSNSFSQVFPITLYVDENCEAVVPDYTDDVTVVDNCPAGTVVTQVPVAGTLISLSQPCSVIATDAAGNASSLTFNLIAN